MLFRSIKEEKEKPKIDENSDKPADYPSDDDDADEAYEYEQWKIRELKRIKLDKDDREAREKERQEIERRRNLTEKQRLEENKLLGTDESEKPERHILDSVFCYLPDSSGALFPVVSTPADLLTDCGWKAPERPVIAHFFYLTLNESR